jgi:hypothetical protein
MLSDVMAVDQFGALAHMRDRLVESDVNSVAQPQPVGMQGGRRITTGGVCGTPLADAWDRGFQPGAAVWSTTDPGGHDRGAGPPDHTRRRTRQSASGSWVHGVATGRAIGRPPFRPTAARNIARVVDLRFATIDRKGHTDR